MPRFKRLGFVVFAQRRGDTRRTQRAWGGLLAAGALLAFFWFDSFGRRGAGKLPGSLGELCETLRLCERKRVINPCNQAVEEV